MEREIKFRYRYTDGKNWLFSVYTLAQISNSECFEFLSDQPLLKYYKNVGQDEYTGLKDKNGVEIYEGDIIHKRFEDIVEEKGFIDIYNKVGFENGTFGYYGEITKYFFPLYDNIDGYDVAGNIFENSELLNQSTK